MPLGPVTSVKRSARVPSAPLQIVAEQPAAQQRRIARREPRGAERLVSQHPSLNDEDVEVAVVVVVEQRDARRHDLRVEQLARHAVEVNEVQTRLRRQVDEPWRLGSRLAPLCRPVYSHTRRTARAPSAAARNLIWQTIANRYTVSPIIKEDVVDASRAVPRGREVT